MVTSQNPSKCPKCKSKNVYLGAVVYEKDCEGQDTNTAISGTWFCGDCGDVLGSKQSKYQNDISEESI